MTPLRLGRWLVVMGAILTAIGLITGFAAMTTAERGLILNLLGLTPVGVLLAFCGTILVVLTEPRGAVPPVEPPPSTQLESDADADSTTDSELFKRKS